MSNSHALQNKKQNASILYLIEGRLTVSIARIKASILLSLRFFTSRFIVLVCYSTTLCQISETQNQVCINNSIIQRCNQTCTKNYPSHRFGDFKRGGTPLRGGFQGGVPPYYCPSEDVLIKLLEVKACPYYTRLCLPETITQTHSQEIRQRYTSLSQGSVKWFPYGIEWAIYTV